MCGAKTRGRFADPPVTAVSLKGAVCKIMLLAPPSYAAAFHLHACIKLVNHTVVFPMDDLYVHLMLILLNVMIAQKQIWLQH